MAYLGEHYVSEGLPCPLDVLNNINKSEFKAKIEPRLGRGAKERSIAAPHDVLAGLVGIKPSSTPMSRSIGRGQRDALDAVGNAEPTLYRRCVGILMCLGPDRFDLQLVCKVVAVDLSCPMKFPIARLRLSLRYALGIISHGLSRSGTMR